MDFETCAKLVDANIELNDLIAMKQSYLIELKKIEQKRRQVLRSLGKLNNQLNTSRYELGQLENKNSFLRERLRGEAVKLNDIQHTIVERFDQLKSIRTIVDQSKSAIMLSSVAKSSPATGHTIASAIDLTKCPYNRKLSIYWFTPSTKSSAYLNDLRGALDFDELSKSVKFERTPNKNACFTMVILVKRTSKSYYRDLVRFILDNRKKTNWLFLSTNNLIDESFAQRDDLEKYLVSLDPENSETIKRAVSQAVFSSMGSIHDDLTIRFSVAFEAIYSAQRISTDRTSVSVLGEHRNYLFTYHHNLASGRQQRDLVVKPQLAVLRQIFNSSKNLIIDFECQSKVNYTFFEYFIVHNNY